MTWTLYYTAVITAYHAQLASQMLLYYTPGTYMTVRMYQMHLHNIQVFSLLSHPAYTMTITDTFLDMSSSRHARVTECTSTQGETNDRL